MSPEEEIRRAERARAILGDPLVTEALAALESAATEAWRSTGAHDVDTRERAWLMLRLAERFRAHFESLVENGRLAKSRLVELERERRFTLFR